MEMIAILPAHLVELPAVSMNGMMVDSENEKSLTFVCCRLASSSWAFSFLLLSFAQSRILR